MTKDSLASLIGWFCSVWLAVIVALYLITFNEDLCSGWLQKPDQLSPQERMIVTGVMVLLYFVIQPLALLFRLRQIWLQGSRGVAFGLSTGFFVALWTSGVFLAVPYLGGYFSLPGAAIGDALSGHQNRGPVYILAVLGFNFIGWPIICALVSLIANIGTRAKEKGTSRIRV